MIFGSYYFNSFPPLSQRHSRLPLRSPPSNLLSQGLHHSSRFGELPRAPTARFLNQCRRTSPSVSLRGGPSRHMAFIMAHAAAHAAPFTSMPNCCKRRHQIASSSAFTSGSVVRVLSLSLAGLLAQVVRRAFFVGPKILTLNLIPLLTVSTDGVCFTLSGEEQFCQHVSEEMRTECVHVAYDILHFIV